MRNLLLILLLSPLVSIAQDRPLPVNAFGNYEFVRKVSVNESQKEIFKRLQEWLAIRKFGEPVSITTQNNKTFTGKLSANNYDYIDTAEHRIRGSGYVLFSQVRPYMYVTFDYQLIAENGSFTYDFKRFNVIRFIKGKSMKAHSFQVSIYSGGGGNVSDAQSVTKSLEQIVSENQAKKSKIIRSQNTQDIDMFKDNMQSMILQLNSTVKGEF